VEDPDTAETPAPFGLDPAQDESNSNFPAMSAPDQPPAVAVFVHGLWHGAWAWDETRATLAERGVQSHAIELPLTSLTDDVAALETVLDTVADDVVLIGHSYGGAVITAAQPRPNLRHLIYLTAYQLDAGETMAKVFPDLELPPPALGAAIQRDRERGITTLDPALARDVLYHDVPADVADAAVARLRPSALALFRESPGTVSWRSVPSTYVVCAQDRALVPPLQRAMAGRAGTVVEWPVGHSPAAACPGAIADLVGLRAVAAP
jgi:pimeloyl-ACP methyl ester carboxylesterase